MVNPHTQIGCVANVYVRMMFFRRKGEVEHGHKHVFDHLTLLAHGSLKVTVNGKESVFKAPQMIFIKAEYEHEIEALEAGTVAYCVHALRDGDGVGDIIDPASIPAGVDPTSVTNPVAISKV